MKIDGDGCPVVRNTLCSVFTSTYLLYNCTKSQQIEEVFSSVLCVILMKKNKLFAKAYRCKTVIMCDENNVLLN